MSLDDLLEAEDVRRGRVDGVGFRGAHQAKPAPQPAAERQTQHPPPTAAAGFAFRQKIDDAASVCTEAGREWKSATDSEFACSGPAADLGFDATVAVRFCEKAVCGLRVVTAPETDDGRAWAQRFTAIKSALTEKYGRSTGQEIQVPSECKGSPLFDCLKAGRARASFIWHWSTGESITATMSRFDGGPAIHIEYKAGPTRVQKDAL